MAWEGRGPGGSFWCDGGIRPLVSEGVWAALASQGVARRYRTGDVMVVQGHGGDRVIVLVDGRVKVTRNEADGTEVLLAIRDAGEIIGEMSALDGSVASATVTALRPCATRVVPVGEFLYFVRSHDMVRALLRHAAARRRESEQIRIELTTLTVSRRLIRTLLRLMDSLGTASGGAIAVDLGLPQEELARAIGASRSQLAASLAWLRGLGLVSTERRRVLIHDAGGLRKLDTD
ncbi:MAG TPA: Crp/Fnr family transcriptional regulator [Candidatus Dormibacteraeota bacterium]|nr:Crp/Fnr family transcriptional regulator [Candidatus Dormibacteraeota bacterium]